MKKIFPVVVFLMLVIPGMNTYAVSGAKAYKQMNDAGAWLSLNLEKKFTPLLSACFSEELRLNENFTQTGTVFSDIGLSYSFLKIFRVAAFYRYENKRRLDLSYDTRHGYYFELYAKEKISPVKVVLRLKYESVYTDINASEEGYVPKNNAVVKLTLKYDLHKKYEPYLYGETCFWLNNPRYYSFDQLRLCGGIEYTFNRMHALDVHYLFQKEYDVKHPETDYIIGISYYFTF